MYTARTHRLSVKMQKTIPFTHGGYSGYRSINVGDRSAEVIVSIDVDKLIRLYARRAMTSKSGKATLNDGAIVFRVDKTTVIETPHEPAYLDGTTPE